MADDRAETASTTAQHGHRADASQPESSATMIRRVVLRVVLVIAVLGLSAIAVGVAIGLGVGTETAAFGQRIVKRTDRTDTT